MPGPPYFLAALQQRQGVACSTSRPVNPGAGGLRTTRAALQLGATLAARASGAAARAVEAAAAGGGQRKAAADTAEVRASRGGRPGLERGEYRRCTACSACCTACSAFTAVYLAP